MGFRLGLKLGIPIQSHLVTTPSRLLSISSKGFEASINLTRLWHSSVFSEEGDTLFKDPLKKYATHSSQIPTLDHDSLEREVPQMNADENSQSCFNAGDAKVFFQRPSSSLYTGIIEKGTSPFRLLLENLIILEESFTDINVLKLEKDILLQLGRLGALELFNTRLSRSHEMLTILDLSDVRIETIGGCETVDGRKGKIVVSSGKKVIRKSVKERAASKLCEKARTADKKIKKFPGNSAFSLTKSTSKTRRLMIARNESEMARGVKVVSSLERIRDALEKQSGGVVSLSCWAEAAAIDEKLLQQNLHFGWYCRDELIRSTRSLVLHLSRNYRGMGISLEDLVQAGNIGVLNGAERFDQARGYRFSTYVQYWIRKAMSQLVTQHARGIQIPSTLSRAVNQIQKARKNLSNGIGKSPDDNEIAKFTGLSLTKVESASKCLRIVGSIDQKMAPCINAKYLDFYLDTSVQSPEEAVMRQHIKRDISDILGRLESRERRVLALRHGFEDHQPKSLEEIGRALQVSKEWVRRIEKKVITRLRDQGASKNLSHYINL